MKHLRKFNESYTQQDLDELQEFCDMYLAYLVDDGFWIDIYRENLSYQIISLEKEPPADSSLEDDYDWEISSERRFSWNQVKDQYISFLQMLSKTYELGKIVYYNLLVDVLIIHLDNHSIPKVKTYNIYDFISDSFNDELNSMDIVGIKIAVKL